MPRPMPRDAPVTSAALTVLFTCFTTQSGRRLGSLGWNSIQRIVSSSVGEGLTGARQHVGKLQLVNVPRAKVRAAQPNRNSHRLEFDILNRDSHCIHLRTAV